MSQSDQSQQSLSESGEVLTQENLTLSEQEEADERVQLAEEPFDPEKPADLLTEVEKRDAIANSDENATDVIVTEEDSRDGESESDDSIVNDEIEYSALEHEKMTAFAIAVDEFLLLTLDPKSASKRERRAAICEVLCDHYCGKQ